MKEIEKESFIITCPHCGAQYLPSEIFIEEGLLGDAHSIIRTSDGKIEHYLGNPFDLHESYVCDFCNKEFKIDGTMTFTTSKVDSFDEEYVKPLYTNRIELGEE